MAKNVIDLLNEIANLMSLKGENPFKIRAYEKAADILAGREDLADLARAGTLKKLSGVGKTIEDVVSEFLLTGHSKIYDELAKSIPPGLIELTGVPGVGPKKALTLIDKLGIHSLAELEYACKENRLLNLKGFGPKIQGKILEGILFSKSSQGLKRICDVDSISEELLEKLKSICPGARVSKTGALRRHLEIIERFEFLIELKNGETESRAKGWFTQLSQSSSLVLPLELHFATPEEFGYELARTTGTQAHWAALGQPPKFKASTEESFYEKLNLPWIPPEARETGEEIGLARNGQLDKLLPWDGVRGIFHNHTIRSDGSATLEQMVAAAEAEGYEYIGISDHSQSAFYAQGLKKEALIAQEKEIRAIQEKHPKIRIFWGIESDILADGALDYEAEVLHRFDFVIASIHSRFQMDRQEMTKRIIKAIQNPYTRFLGHPTGRLLLGRKGYEVDMEAILTEAAASGVAVELNSNPARLDIDWRWGGEMRKQNTFTSINPDAHSVEGISDTRYGIAMARKALLPVHQVVNAKSAGEVEKWLKRN